MMSNKRIGLIFLGIAAVGLMGSLLALWQAGVGSATGPWTSRNVARQVGNVVAEEPIQLVVAPASVAQAQPDLPPAQPSTDSVARPLTPAEILAQDQNASATAPSRRPFPVFSAMMYSPQPNWQAVGMQPLTMEYGSTLWAPGKNTDEPDLATCREHAREAVRAGHMVCIDIERWPIDIRGDSKATVEKSLRKLAAVADAFREVGPNLRIGFYSLMPITDYWTPVNALNNRAEQKKGGIHAPYLAVYEKKFKAWQEANDFVRERLGPHVDVLFPCLYTFRPETSDWIMYARGNIAEARRWGKPVYPFIWFRFHESEKDMHNAILSGPMWRAQLNTMADLADGVVIWGGWKEQWNPQAPWWKETADFLRQHHMGANFDPSALPPASRPAQPASGR